MKLLDVNSLRHGPYFELNVSGDEVSYTHWDSASLFLQEPVFDAFVHCFEESADELNYYGPTRFARVELLKLKDELEENGARVEAASDPESFVAAITRSSAVNNFFLELKHDNYDWELGWKMLADSLIELNDALLNLINTCIREGRILWVLGI